MLFVAAGESFNAFEARFRRMRSLDDGMAVAFLQLSNPIGGSWYEYPPLTDNVNLVCSLVSSEED